eukprot:g3485.t1
MSSKVYVKGEDIGRGQDGIEEEELRDVFSKFGNIEAIWVAHQPSGFAFVTFENEDDANKAIAEMDGQKIKDCQVMVQMSNKRERDRESASSVAPRSLTAAIGIAAMMTEIVAAEARRAIASMTEATTVDTAEVRHVTKMVTEIAGVTEVAVAVADAVVTTDAETIVTDTETIVTDAETIVTDAETIVIDAETIVTDAETIVTDAETIVTDAETIVTDAETIVTDAEMTAIDVTRSKMVGTERKSPDVRVLTAHAKNEV